MSAVNNVVAINKSNVYEDILVFLGKLESDNSRDYYDRSIRRFFKFMKNKDIENLDIDDVKVRNADVIKYQQFLKQQYSNSTVNVYLAPIASLYEFLEINEYPVKSKVVKVDILSNDSESYGKINLDEARTMAEIVRKQVKGFEKSCLIRLAYTTSIRESALLSLEWSNIKPSEQGDFYIIKVIDKGNKEDKKPISKELYEQLLQIQGLSYYKKYNDNKIFHLTTKTVWQMMKSLREEMGIPDERNITFHSLKNVAINWELETTGDINRAKRQGNHSNVQTTLKHYANNDNGLETMAGVQMENAISDDIFDQLTQEELLTIIKGTVNGVNHVLKMAAKKIIEGR